MITHSLIQGTPDWHAYRAQHFNASDAPAMLGMSPYKSRTQLLHEMATGMSPEVDAVTQKRFADGHRFEELARTLAEEIVGEDLYPVTGSEGKLSASFDGLTMAGSIAWEHKTINDAIRAAATANDLPIYLRIQMEQQMMISFAEKCLFLASKWDDQNQLIEAKHLWYTSDQDIRTSIVQGWTQFAIDLESYAPPEVAPEVIGRTPETLPALHIEVTGMVTASNLAAYKEHALEVFKGINRELTTDQQFADAEKTVKWCGEVEDRLEGAKQHALSQTASIDDLFRTIDSISAEARATRLELEKLVKARKESLREEIRQGAVNALRDHYTAINESLVGVAVGAPAAFGSDVAGAMKGKKTIASLRDAADTTLANAKIDADKIAGRVRENLSILKASFEYAFLMPDAAQLAVTKEPETLELMVKSRIADHKAAETKKAEELRAKIAEEERIKAEAKVREEAAIAEAKLLEEGRQKAARELAEFKANAEQAQAVATELALKVAADPHPSVAYQPLTAERAGLPVIGIDLATAPDITVYSSAPTLTLGQISGRLGFNLTADFLRSIGFEPTKVRAASLYHESDWHAICTALISHIHCASETQTQAA